MADKKNVEETPKAGSIATIEANGKVLNVQDLLAQMEKAEVGQELGSDYFTMEPGESKRVILTGITQMKGMGAKSAEMVDAAELVGTDGRRKICGDTVIVSLVQNLLQKEQLPKPVQITCTGTTKGKNGFSYKEFEINALLM